MNVLKFLFCSIFAFFSFAVSAQDNTTPSDEELKKYAVAMDSIENMKSDLLKSISEFVKNSDKISGARYNELSKIIDDQQKLAESKATADEIAAVQEVLTKKNEGTAKIQETFQSLAKDYVGAAVYNKVKKALAADPEVKTRYEKIMAEISNKES